MTSAGTCLRWLAWSGIAALMFISFFIAFPNFDLWVSGVFGTSGQGFALRGMSGWNAVRATMIALTDGMVAGAIGLLLVGWFYPRMHLIRTRVLLFCITAYAIGPGLVVNGILKTYSQRARPWNVAEFGGDARYSRPFELAGQCGGHCSFVSGEASALSVIAVIALLTFVPSLPREKRRNARFAIVAIAVLGSVLRVAFGAHFASDVIFAAVFMNLMVPALFLAFGLHRLASPFVRRDGPQGLGTRSGKWSASASEGSGTSQLVPW